MEGLIFAIVIFIISSLLGKNKKDDKQTKQMPPFSKQQVPPSQPMKADPVKTRPVMQSLDDFANEVFGQLNKQTEPKPLTQEVIEPKLLSETVVDPRSVTREALREVKEPRATMRPKLGESRPLVQQATSQAIDVVPRTRKQLMQAIVASEILGPPKAKQ